jgi:multidrug efflux pump subunit AcrB
VNQVLNFGLTSPIDVQVQTLDIERGYDYARDLRDRIRQVPGTQDVTIKQVMHYPTLHLNVDRIRAAQLGLTQRDVANSMLISLSSSSLVAPSYFLNPKNNVNYTVVVKVPIPQINTVDDLMTSPVTPTSLAVYQSEQGPLTTVVEEPRVAAQPLGNLALLETQTTMDEISHNNVQRVLDITANVEGRDLGSVQRGIRGAITRLGKLPAGMKINVLGQGQVMEQAFTRLGLGLILAIVLVYLLMVILFQSWLDPFIVMMAVPGSLVGIGWMLLATGTTINVNSFMGSIMSVGIAASNSILLVSFANQARVDQKLDAMQAALEAGRTRLRPVLMTALAMILGMLPTALAIGEGGEQNAPLGRAVIGGLLVATFVTLFVVPVVYSLLRTEIPTAFLMDKRFEAEEQGKEFHPEEALNGA